MSAPLTISALLSPKNNTLSTNNLTTFKDEGAKEREGGKKRKKVKIPNDPRRASRLLFPKAPLWKRLFLRHKIKHSLTFYPSNHPSHSHSHVHAHSHSEGGGGGGGQGEQHHSMFDRFDVFDVFDWAIPIPKFHSHRHLSNNDSHDDLFDQILHQVHLTLLRDPLAGVVPPSLLVQEGTIPLSILSVIPDIMDHYKFLISGAKKEVLIATNYWQNSKSTKRVKEGLLELQKRAKEKGERRVVKVMVDRGSFKQLFRNHLRIPQSAWSALDFPAPEDIPNIDLEIINYHRPLLGTFHCKFMVVDRKVALINSNNIQDRPNLEMMCHLEGPIVDSFYETFLISWARSLRPLPPCLGDPYTPPDQYLFQENNPYLEHIEIAKAAKAARLLLQKQNKQTTDEFEKFMKEHEQSGLLWSLAGVGAGDKGDKRRRSFPVATWFGDSTTGAGSGTMEGKRKSLMEVVQEAIYANWEGGLSGRGNATPSRLQHQHQQKPVEMSDRKRESNAEEEIEGSDASMTAVSSSTEINEKRHEIPSASSSVPLQDGLKHKVSHSELPQLRIVESAVEGHERDMSSPSHVRTTSANTASSTKSRLQLLSDALNVGALSHPTVTASDEEIEDFTPHILHKPHEPFRIALVNRKPHGAPGHQDIRVPQAAAWLAGFRYAKDNVFVQTPTLNAKPVVRAILETCKRKIKVVLYLDLGFNDKGESVPFQGGTNEEVVGRLYKELREFDRHEYLDVYWYTGKDQRKPLNAVKKQRNCHVKFMTIDNKVGIMGNGNQDTQSWFHSSEINIMVDSPQIVADWMNAIRSNQNTEKYGKVGKDGIWRGENGDVLEPPEKVSCISAILAMI